MEFQSLPALREVTLRWLISAHSALILHFCQHPARLDVGFGFPFPSASIYFHSELFPPLLAFALPGLEHPLAHSLVIGEIARTLREFHGGNYPPRDGARFPFYDALRIVPHQVVVSSKFHLSLIPLHVLCLDVLWRFGLTQLRRLPLF